MREFSLALDARPTEVTAIAIAIAFHEGFRRMGRHEDFPGFVKSAANILAPVHWDLGHVDEHYFPIRDFRASADLVAPRMATSMATSPERRSPARVSAVKGNVSAGADGLDDEVRARLLAQRAVALCESGRLDEALPDSERALELAERSADPGLIAAVLPARHLALAGPEWP